jgi:hypothetical protein
MNAGTCWGKNTIDPSGQGIEKPRKATLTLKKKTLSAAATAQFQTALNFFSPHTYRAS